MSGLRYETQIRTLNQFPDTLLGDPSRRIRCAVKILSENELAIVFFLDIMTLFMMNTSLTATETASRR